MYCQGVGSRLDRGVEVALLVGVMVAVTVTVISPPSGVNVAFGFSVAMVSGTALGSGASAQAAISKI